MQARKAYWDLLKQKRILASSPNDPHSADGKRGHAQRAAVLAEWLCGLFGEESLRQTGVVDVAGGRGELAFELGVKRRIPCVVIDPRCPSEASTIGRWENFKLSKPHRSWLEGTIAGLGGYPECQAYVANCPVRQSGSMVTKECTDPTSKQYTWWRDEVIRSCKVVVGLHPDQATGGVLDLALAFGRGFAVVPCCTFADDFPERRLPGGQCVRTYDDLVEWLRLRGSGTETCYLPFHGKNQVIFNRGLGDAPPSIEVPQPTCSVQEDSIKKPRLEDPPD